MKFVSFLIILLLTAAYTNNVLFVQFASSTTIPIKNDLGLSMNFSKGSYSPGDTIEISGTARTNTTAVISLVDNKGTVVHSTKVNVDKYRMFTAEFVIPKNVTTSIWRVILADNLEEEISSIVINSTNQTTSIFSWGGPTFAFLSSPLDQYRSGVLTNKVVCQDYLQLVIKSEDGSPACVSPVTAHILIERGWGHLP